MGILISLLMVFILLPTIFGGCGNVVSVEEGDEMVSEKTIPPIDRSVPEVTETATFAMGWFWGPDSRFGSIDGVVRTRVGYSGGEKENPTYYSLGGHSETIQIDYDPSKITYEELLDVFWDSHAPGVPSYSTQYRNAVFYHNEEQKELATESKQRYAEKTGANVYTEILPFTGFYLAEDYHQKYYLRHETEIYRELRQIYPDTEDFVNSTAAARLNGYAGAYGTEEELENGLDDLELSGKAEERLLSIARRGLRPGCSVN